MRYCHKWQCFSFNGIFYNGKMQNNAADLSQYVKGSLFSKGSVIGAGQAGTEVVLLLEKARAMSMIADNIMEHSSSAGSASELCSVIKQIVTEGAVTAMMNNSMNNKPLQYIQNSINIDGDMLARALSRASKERECRYNPTPKYGY